MKSLAMIMLLVFCFQSCGLREREKELDAKTKEVNEKEQQLMLREKAIELKEKELMSLQQKLDSTGVQLPKDTVAVNPEFLGEWNVRMNCIETSCQGSAVGDTKTETWLIEKQENNITAKAMSANQLVRAYTGRFNGSFLVLNATQTDSSKVQARITVRLQRINTGQLEGQREISRPGDCRILYELQLKRMES